MGRFNQPIPPYALTEGMLTYLDSAGTVLPYADDSALGQKCIFCEKESKQKSQSLSLFESPLSDSKFSLSWKNVCAGCYVLGPQQLERYRNSLNRRGLRTEVIHKGNGTFMTARLQIYLDSEGSVLPKDFEKYRPGGAKDGLCLFCDDVPADFPVYLHVRGTTASNPGMVKVPTQTKACGECMADAKELYIDHGIPQAELFDTENFHVKNLSGHRLKKYVVEGAFDTEVDLYYQHKDAAIGSPNNIMDPGTAPFREDCYFYNKPLFSMPYKLIDVPVRVSNHFTGGEVRICKACQKQKQDLEMLPNAADMSILTEEESCPLCTKPYLVNAFEARFRASSGTRGMHMCPTCCFKANFKGEESMTFGVRNDKSLRHSECQCEYCSEDFMIDLTLQRSYLKTKFVSKDAKLCCFVCNFSGKFPIFVGTPSTSNYTKIRCYRIKQKVVLRCFRQDVVVDTKILKILPEEIPFII